MTQAVVSAPFEHRDFVMQNLVANPVHIITGSERVYVVHLVDRRGTDLTLVDPIDGELLVECRFFDDAGTARAWIASDIAIRSLTMHRRRV